MYNNYPGSVYRHGNCPNLPNISNTPLLHNHQSSTPQSPPLPPPYNPEYFK